MVEGLDLLLRDSGSQEGHSLTVALLQTDREIGIVSKNLRRRKRREMTKPSDIAAKIADLTPEKQALLMQWLKENRANQPEKSSPAPSASEASAASEAPVAPSASLKTGLSIQSTTPLALPSRGEIIPLSFAQERLWFLDRLEPGNPTYNISTVYQLTGPLNIKALEQGINEVVRRHESLRTTFALHDEQPVQTIAPTLTVPLLVTDLHDLSGAEQEVQIQRLIAAEERFSFDLAEGPLLRTSLLRLGREKHVFSLVIHHIISDGWSISLFEKELSTLYLALDSPSGLDQETLSSLPELPVQYADYAIWQRQWLQGKNLERQLAYWRAQLKGVPAAMELPTDRPRPPHLTHRGAQHSVILPQDLRESLKSLSSRAGATLFMALLTAFKILLHRYTGQDDIIVGVPIANRNRIEIEDLMGFFLNSLTLRTDCTSDPSFRELLGRVRQVALEAYTHQDIPFEKLLEELRPVRDMSRTPLFQVFFNMLSLEEERIELPGLHIERVVRTNPDSKFDLTLYVREDAEGLALQLVYSTDLFNQKRMVEMLAQYCHLLRQIVENPDQKIKAYSLVTETAEPYLPDPRQPLRADWHEAVHTQFSRQAARTPQHLAVIDPQDHWTYAELDRRSNQLANFLSANGIQPGDIVAIYAHRSASLVWALLGVLKVGAAFVILDAAGATEPDYPLMRLINYVEITKPRGFIQLEAAGPLPHDLETVVAAEVTKPRLILPRLATLAEQDPFQGYPAKEPDITLGPDDLAYIAFTSGSTGQPKAVLGRHGPLSHFLPWQMNVFNLRPADRFSMLSGLSHDPLQRDIFTALWVGATICIPDPDIIGTPGQLAAWLGQEKITFAHLTPPMSQLITSTAQSANTTEPDCHLPDLRYAFFVGDKLTRQDVTKLHHLAPKITCINSYGTTETQRAVGYYPIRPEMVGARSKGEQGSGGMGEWGKAVYPLGRGMPNVQLLVLNKAQQLAGVGEIGEIHVRSPHLAQGYLNDDTLTRTRFLTNPLTGQFDDRLYKTGDLGRYLPDGTVEFVSRVDRQIKIRGFRIEPGEIETILAQHPAVQEAVVVARERQDVVGGSRGAEEKIQETRSSVLVAYVVSHTLPLPAINDLRAFLKTRVPYFMVPATFILLEALPLTSNGKIDYQALPKPGDSATDRSEPFVAPETQIEMALAKIWTDILGIKSIGIHDNFFALGGHSLLGARVISRIQDLLDVVLPLRTIFDAPTIAELAVSIEEILITEIESLTDAEVDQLTEQI